MVQQSRAQGRQRKFIGPKRPRQRMFPAAFNRLAFANQNAGLWPAQQFVAAKRHPIGTGPDAFLHHRFVAQPKLGRVVERARAEIIQDVGCWASDVGRGLSDSNQFFE